MGLIVNTSTVIRNLSIGPLSGGGNGGGGGGSSEPSYLAVGAQGVNSYAGAAYIYDATNYSATPPKHTCLLYTSPSPRDRQKSRMPSSA